MSRSIRDILETERMLSRLASVLSDHCYAADQPYSEAVADAESLRRISMTLHRWHEMECGSDAGAIERDENTNKPYWVRSDVSRSSGYRPYPVADRETGALKRLAKIMARYPALTAYVQTDPRGCALYILKPGDVPAGENADSYYSRGLAVFQ